MSLYLKYVFLLGCFFLCSLYGHSQAEPVRWLRFEQLEDSLTVKPKKVFVDFYADWCAYCKKMDRVAFRDPRVVERLNSEFYAVRMDVESSDTILFDGRRFGNPELGKRRRPVHEIPRLLASREGRPFSLPAMVILDGDFRVLSRYFEYLSPEKLAGILESHSP